MFKVNPTRLHRYFVHVLHTNLSQHLPITHLQSVVKKTLLYLVFTGEDGCFTKLSQGNSMVVFHVQLNQSA